MKKAIHYSFLSLFIYVLLVGQNKSYAQAALFPYPTTATYTAGSFLSTKISSGNVLSAYNNWATGAASGLPTSSPSNGPGYLSSCGGGKYSVSNGGGTYSEGIGYGMLLTVYMGDKTAFDGLWAFYKGNMDGNGLMNWNGTNCGSTSGNGATDGDEDAAMALIVASKQWPAATSPYTYATEATTLINNIKAHETMSSCSSPANILKPGDAFGGCSCINASYFAPGYYREFACFTGDSFWNNLADDVYISLNNAISSANGNLATGLVPAWQTNSGTPGGTSCNGTATYQYDACRTPWRIGLDYLWFGTPAAKTYLNLTGNWAKGVGISNIKDGYNLNGTLTGCCRNSAFIGPFNIAAMAMSQADADNFGDWWINESPTPGSNKIDDAPYFQNTLRPLVMLLAAGKMWKPSVCGPTITCKQPNLGATTISTCGSSFPVLLNSNTNTDAAHSVTFTWKRITPSPTTLVSASTTANTYSVTAVNGAGTYAVIRDSNGVCSNSDTVVITSTLPTPALGPDPAALCTTTYYDLTPSNTAAFPGGTTWQWDVDYSGGTTYSTLTGETNSTLLNVRKAGRYRLTASISGCSSTSDDVVITSNMPTPVDACISSSGNITLSIANPGLNGTNYNWYTTAGGSTLATVTSGSASNTTSIATNVASTTTFYVQDMSVSAGSGTVGPTARLSAGGYTSKGGTTQRLIFSTLLPNITIDKIDVYVITYATTNLDFTVKAFQSDNTTQIGSTINTTTITSYPSSNPAYNLVTLTLPGGLTIPSVGTGYELEVIMSAGTNGNMFYSQSVSPPWASYTSPGINITGNYNQASDYSFAYNWQYSYSSGTVCNRLPVVAKVGGCTAAAPVVLVSFYAEKDNNRTILNWYTASEINNDYFNIERSSDGINFEVIGKVKGKGNTSGVSVYSFADENTPSGKIYYRLMQYDYDGVSTSSYVISVDNETTLALQVAPNPFGNATEILVSSNTEAKVKVRITDLSGHALYEGIHNVNEKISVGENMTAGIYILQVQINDVIKTVKIIKQ